MTIPRPYRPSRRRPVLDYDDAPPQPEPADIYHEPGEHQCTSCGLPVDTLGELCPRCEDGTFR